MRRTRVLQQGLAWGAIAVFLALIGMVEAFAARQVVADVVSLAMLLLFVAGFAPGYAAGSDGTGRPPGARLGDGAAAGALAGAVLAALVVLAGLINLRHVFINASPALFALLSGGAGWKGAHWPVVFGAAAGLAGAL
ncbi:MAG: hypothetical protein L6Q72_13225, partial [Burkholderiaceae bacterium]|nr:hypothetical protein [Burkholderiaceae bacterium]